MYRGLSPSLHTALPFRRISRPLQFASCIFAASLLSGCLGDDDSGPISYRQQVVFGDSLSDSGSYAVGAIAAAHGGKFTVNSVPASPRPGPNALPSAYPCPRLVRPKPVWKVTLPKVFLRP